MEFNGNKGFNSNIEFSASIARPKKGISFEPGNEYVQDLEYAVNKFNESWGAIRRFEILGYEGITVKMVYRSVDLVRKRRTVVKFLQEISRTLAYERDWNSKVTRKPGAIFTLEFHTNIDEELPAPEEAKEPDVDQESLKQSTEEMLTQLETLVLQKLDIISQQIEEIISQKMDVIANDVKAAVLDRLKTITTTIANDLEKPGNIEIIIKKRREVN